MNPKHKQPNETIEEWEARRRKELMETVPNGIYNMSTPSITLLTGKGGYIDCRIALEKSLIEM